MTAPLHPPRVRSLFAGAGTLVRANFELFVLLAALWTIVNGLLTWPLRPKFAAFEAKFAGVTDATVLWSGLREIAPSILLSAGASVVPFGVFAVIWVRAVAPGRRAVFAPGFPRRVLGVMARNLALFGYGFLLGVGAILATLLIKGVVGVSGAILGPGVGAILHATLSILFAAAVLSIFFALVAAFLITAAGKAIDRSTSLFEVSRALLCAHRGVIAAFTILIAAAILVALGFNLLFGAETGQMPSLWQALGAGFFGFCLNLFGLAMGVVALGSADDGNATAGS